MIRKKNLLIHRTSFTFFFFIITLFLNFGIVYSQENDHLKDATDYIINSNFRENKKYGEIISITLNRRPKNVRIEQNYTIERRYKTSYKQTGDEFKSLMSDETAKNLALTASADLGIGFPSYKSIGFGLSAGIEYSKPLDQFGFGRGQIESRSNSLMEYASRIDIKYKDFRFDTDTGLAYPSKHHNKLINDGFSKITEEEVVKALLDDYQENGSNSLLAKEFPSCEGNLTQSCLNQNWGYLVDKSYKESNGSRADFINNLNSKLRDPSYSDLKNIPFVNTLLQLENNQQIEQLLANDRRLENLINSGNTVISNMRDSFEAFIQLQRDKEDFEKKMARLDNQYKGLKAGLDIAYFIFQSEDARKAIRITQEILKGVDFTRKMALQMSKLDQNANTWSQNLQFAANWIGIGITIMTILSDSDEESPEMQALRQVLDFLNQFRNEMHDRFDYVDESLREIFDTMVHSFDLTFDYLETNQDIAKTSSEKLNRIQRTINRLNGKIDTYTKELLQNDAFKELSLCQKYSRLSSSTNLNSDLATCLLNISYNAHTLSESTAFTIQNFGDEVSIIEKHPNNISGLTYSILANINLEAKEKDEIITQVLQHYNIIPNYEIWSDLSKELVVLLLENEKKVEDLNKGEVLSIIDGLIDRGKRIRRSHKKLLFKNDTLVRRTVLNNALNEYDEMANYLKVLTPGTEKDFLIGTGSQYRHYGLVNDRDSLNSQLSNLPKTKNLGLQLKADFDYKMIDSISSKSDQDFIATHFANYDKSSHSYKMIELDLINEFIENQDLLQMNTGLRDFFKSSDGYVHYLAYLSGIISFKQHWFFLTNNDGSLLTVLYNSSKLNINEDKLSKLNIIVKPDFKETIPHFKSFTSQHANAKMLFQLLKNGETNNLNRGKPFKFMAEEDIWGETAANVLKHKVKNNSLAEEFNGAIPFKDYIKSIQKANINNGELKLNTNFNNYDSYIKLIMNRDLFRQKLSFLEYLYSELFQNFQTPEFNSRIEKLSDLKTIIRSYSATVLNRIYEDKDLGFGQLSYHTQNLANDFDFKKDLNESIKYLKEVKDLEKPFFEGAETVKDSIKARLVIIKNKLDDLGIVRIEIVDKLTNEFNDYFYVKIFYRISGGLKFKTDEFRNYLDKLYTFLENESIEKNYYDPKIDEALYTLYYCKYKLLTINKSQDFLYSIPELANQSYVNLSGMELKNIPLLDSLNQLISLNLSFNNISNKTKWSGYKNLENIDLSNNNLKVISNKFYDNYPNLNYINLKGNPIKKISKKLLYSERIKIICLDEEILRKLMKKYPKNNSKLSCSCN